MREIVRVGIIGTGVGLRTILPGFERTKRAKVTALSGRTSVRAAELGADRGIGLLTGDYREVSDSPDVDLICVASPTHLHLEQGLYALRTGKPVYLEKPVGLDEDEAIQLADAASGRLAPVFVGHQLRFNPYLRTMRNEIGSGLIGRPYHLAIAQAGSGFADPSRDWTWEFESQQGGGVRLAMGSHLFDLAMYLTNSEVTAVTSVMDAVHPVRTPAGGGERQQDTSSYFAAMLEMDHALNAVVSTSAAAHSPFEFSIVVRGEAGDLTFSVDAGLLLHRLGQAPSALCGDDVATEYERRRASSIFSTSFTYFADDIVGALLGGTGVVPDAADLQSAATTMRLLDAAHRSHLSGTRELLASWSRTDLT